MGQQLPRAEKRLELVARPASRGGASPSPTISQRNPLHIEVVLPVDQLNSVSTGVQATVYPQAPVGGEYRAEVVTRSHHRHNRLRRQISFIP